MSRVQYCLCAGIAAVMAPSVASADLVYYMPFDNGVSASLVNSGTASGVGSAVIGISSAPAPTASTAQVAPNLGSSHSEYYSVLSATNAAYGAIVLPNSTGNFRLNNASQSMTISTWVLWNGNTVNPSTSAEYSGSTGGIAGTLNSSDVQGWGLRIVDGKLRFAWSVDNGSGGSTPRSYTTSSAAALAGQWVNVAMTLSMATGSLNLYVNGSSAGGTTMSGTINSAGNTIQLGDTSHGSPDISGRPSLNGYLDDFAMWDTALSAAQIKAVAAAPSVLAGYNAGVMNGLFSAYAGQSSTAVGDLTWTYATGFDVAGKTVGDTWLGANGNYYMWLSGSGAGTTGLIATSVPEPAAAALLGGPALMLLAVRRIKK